MLRILFVDDSPEEHDAFDQAVDEYTSVEVKYATNYVDALKSVKEHFFHIAIIDLHLSDNEDPYDGINILKEILEQQPQCERIVYSSHLHTSGVVMRLLEPLSCLAAAAIPKGRIGIDGNLESTLTNRVDGFADDAFDLVDFETTLSAIRKTVFNDHRDVEEIELEVRYLVARVLDPLRASKEDIGVRAQVVAGQLFDDGASKSCVFSVRFQWKTDESLFRGGLAVFKIGELNTIRTEARNFAYFVSPTVSHNRRVELLGYAFGASLGLLSYTFAGAGLPTKAIPFREVLTTDIDRAIRLTKLILAPDLHSISLRDSSLFGFAAKRFNSPEFRSDLVLEKIKKLLDKIAQGNTACQRKSNLGLVDNQGRGIEVSDQLLMLPTFRMRFPQCFAHGDLHVGNIFVGERTDDQIVLIDYRHSGPNPRCLDFVILECSARLLLDKDGQADPFEGACRHAAERSLAAELWSASIRKQRSEWKQYSACVIQSCREVFPDISREEYCATAILWGCRLITLRTVGNEQKARILGWIIGLSNFLSV